MASASLMRRIAPCLLSLAPAVALALSPAHAGMERADRMLSRPLEPAWTVEQIKPPPDRYRGGAVYIYRTESPERVGELCRNAKAVGCAIGGVVIGPNPCDFPGERFARLHCHEAGHVLGWSPEHPE